jgi:tetratricopeptide (TPR) repeat protein
MGRIGKKGVILLAIVLVTGSVIVAVRVANGRRLNRLLADANSAIDERDFPLASSRFDEYLRSRPDDLAVRLLAARTARRQGQFDAAREHLDYYQDHNGPPEPRLRELQLLLAAQGSGTSGAETLIAACLSPSPPTDADLVLEVAIEQQLKLLEREFNSGLTLVEGPNAKARAQIEKAIALWLQQRPGRADQVQGLLWRGKLNLMIDRRAAIDDFRRANEMDPNHFDARFHLAASLMEYDVSVAGGHLGLLHGRDPRNPQVTMLLARARRSLGQPESAIKLLDELLDRSLLDRGPAYTAAVLERGKATLDLGRPNDAEPFLRRALAQAPNDPFVHLALSRCLLLTGKETEAKRHEQRYKELQLNNLKAEEDQAAARRDLQNRLDRRDKSPGLPSPNR